jgi:hypothetical protein
LHSGPVGTVCLATDKVLEGKVFLFNNMQRDVLQLIAASIAFPATFVLENDSIAFG